MASRILFLKVTIVSGVTLIFDGTLQIIVQRCQIAALRWPNDISFAADNAIFKNRAQNIKYSFDCVARSADRLKPNFCGQKFVQHGPITIAIHCNIRFLVIFEEKSFNYGSGSNSDPIVSRFACFQCMHSGFLCPKCKNVACLHSRQDQNELHLKR